MSPTQKIAYSLEEATEQIPLGTSSISDAIANNELVAHYGGPKKTRPMIDHDDLKAFVKSLPTEKGRAS